MSSSRLELEMALDLEALVVAAYVFADEFPVPVRPGPAAKVNDAELVALAVGYIRSIIARPKPDDETSFASSICRARS